MCALCSQVGCGFVWSGCVDCVVWVLAVVSMAVVVVVVVVLTVVYCNRYIILLCCLYYFNVLNAKIKPLRLGVL